MFPTSGVYSSEGGNKEERRNGQTSYYGLLASLCVRSCCVSSFVLVHDLFWLTAIPSLLGSDYTKGRTSNQGHNIRTHSHKSIRHLADCDLILVGIRPRHRVPFPFVAYLVRHLADCDSILVGIRPRHRVSFRFFSFFLLCQQQKSLRPGSAASRKKKQPTKCSVQRREQARDKLERVCTVAINLVSIGCKSNISF